MHRDPVAARASTHQESTGEGHEKHQNGNNSKSDAGVIAIRRRAPPRPAALAVASVIATAGGRGGAASSTAVFNDELDVRNCGCARHGEFLYSPDWRALTTCSGARCCGTKSSATSGTLNS